MRGTTSRHFFLTLHTQNKKQAWTSGCSRPMTRGSPPSTLSPASRCTASVMACNPWKSCLTAAACSAARGDSAASCCRPISHRSRGRPRRRPATSGPTSSMRTGGCPAGLCAVPVARRLDVPLIITVHGSDVHLLRYRGLRKLASHVMHRASLVATVSEDLQRQILEFDPRLHTAVLRLPVPSGPPAVPMPADPPIRLLAAGRLSHEKGFDVLIEAMRIAVGSGLDVRLDIVGSGPERRRLALLGCAARRSGPAHSGAAARRADAPARGRSRSRGPLAAGGPRHGGARGVHPWPARGG